MTYILSDGELAVFDESGELVWQGRPMGHPAVQVAELAGSSDAIVLLDYMTGPKVFRNLIRLRSDGVVVWAAELPQSSGSDAYVDFEVSDERLLAHSWSGYRVVIGLGSGRVRGTLLAK